LLGELNVRRIETKKISIVKLVFIQTQILSA
jgi:hypothetical protein